MYSFEFKRRMEKLNPLLIIDDGTARQLNEEWSTRGLYVRRTAQEERLTSTERMHLSGDARSYVDAKESGHRTEFICGVPVGWVPEHDVFSPAGKVLARGWRHILKTLIAKRLTTLDKARRAFSDNSIGEQPYDRMTFEERRELSVNGAKPRKGLF